MELSGTMLSTPTVAIVGGSGALGFGIAVRLAQRRVPLLIGSRDADRAGEAAARAMALTGHDGIAGMANAEAVAAAGVVILSVPYVSHADTLGTLKDAWSDGQLLVDATVPLAPSVGGRATRMVGVWQGSAAQQAAELVPPGVRVVSALHTVSAAALSDLAVQLGEDVLLCGDDKIAKREAGELLALIDGLRPVDAGRLEMSRVCESLTAMLIGINIRYRTHAGIRVTNLGA